MQDTKASRATRSLPRLLANGVHLVGRSFKYHRPRGILSAGVDEPNALVQLGRGARTEPNVRATTQELHHGLVASSQNRWPSLSFDVGAINDVASRLIPAGFYYKTFMWPPTPKWWLRYEHLIRHAAGMGRAASSPDPDTYEHQYAHCDVLVIGAGPAGLAAARSAAHAGARVLVCDENPVLGGSLLGARGDDRWNGWRRMGDGRRRGSRVPRRRNASAADDGIRLLRRHSGRSGRACRGSSSGDPRVDATPASVESARPRGGARLRRARARHRLREQRPAGNDARGRSAHLRRALRGPARVARRRLHEQRQRVRDGACAPGAGIEVAAIVDPRSGASLDGALPLAAREAGLPIFAKSAIVGARGTLHVAAVDVVPLAGGSAARIDCDLVALSGGWNPAVHLHSQARGKLRYDDALATFVPDGSPLPITSAGAANGHGDLAAALAEGHAAGIAAAQRAGLAANHLAPAAASRCRQRAERRRRCGAFAQPTKTAKRFVDWQNDVTVDDIALAAREGYQSVEHLKRYTTLGMGTDQGKVSNIVGLALLAEQLGRPIAEVGTTTFRPPYTPVTLGAFPGIDAGTHVEPTRYSAMHDWHVAHGARFVNAGLWKRPHSYPRAGESPDDAAAREARNVRVNVGDRRRIHARQDRAAGHATSRNS